MNKGLLCLPRPRLPIIVPLEAALDWALPSNHAMMATCLPLYVWFYTYLHQAQLGLDSAHCLIVCGLMCTWSVLVMFSRLYLGVHSPADVVTGGILGGLLLSVYLQVDDQVSPKCQTFNNFLLFRLTFLSVKRALNPFYTTWFW